MGRDADRGGMRNGLACIVALTSAVAALVLPAAAAAGSPAHPFRAKNPAALAVAKRSAQAEAAHGNPLAPVSPGAGGPRAVVDGTLNQPGMAATDNSANQGTPPDPTGA